MVNIKNFWPWFLLFTSMAAPEVPQVEVIIETLNGGSFKLVVQEGSHVAELKAAILKEHPEFAWGKCQLVLGTQPLDDTYTLKPYDLTLTLVRYLPPMKIKNCADSYRGKNEAHRIPPPGYASVDDMVSREGYWKMIVSRECLDRQLSEGLPEINQEGMFDVEQSTASFVFEPSSNEWHKDLYKFWVNLNQQSILSKDPVLEESKMNEFDDEFQKYYFVRVVFNGLQHWSLDHRYMDYIIADQFCQKLARDGHEPVTLPAKKILQPLIFALDKLSTDPNTENLSRSELLAVLRAAIAPAFK